jgi:hypothetical protein
MRVSTGHQTTDRQEGALVAADVDLRDIYRVTRRTVYRALEAAQA